VLDTLPIELIKRFEPEGWQFTLNCNDEIGVSFAATSGAEDCGAGESYCHATEFECRSDSGLQTKQFRSTLVSDLATGRRYQFNQVAFLNEWSTDPAGHEYLVDIFGANGLLFNERYSNSEAIGKVVLALLNQIYDTDTACEPWQADDLALVDNICTAHISEPFDRPRVVLVSMADAVHLADCSPTVEVTAR
jgi:hypothetical protein